MTRGRCYLINLGFAQVSLQDTIPDHNVTCTSYGIQMAAIYYISSSYPHDEPLAPRYTSVLCLISVLPACSRMAANGLALNTGLAMTALTRARACSL